MKPQLRQQLAAALLSLAGATPFAAQAQADSWQFQAELYGWFPGIGGSSSFPANGGGSSVDISTQQVIDALKFAFMGNIGVKNGQWGAWTDLVYADFGASKQGSRDFSIGHQPIPGGVDANLRLDVKNWMWTAVGTYTAVSTPENTLDLLAGTRFLDVRQTLGWSLNGNIGQLPISRDGTSDAEISNWDAIVGVKGNVSFGDRREWFVPYYLDIGAGQSKFTWQGNLGIGYRFGWGSLVASWRYVDYEMKSGHAINDVNFSGPLIGAVFRW